MPAPVEVAAVVELSPKERLKAAQSPVDIEAASRACLASGGLPTDAEALAKVLLLQDEALLLAALEALLDTFERGRPKNAKLLVQRVSDCQPLLTDAHAIDLAKGIRSRLG